MHRRDFVRGAATGLAGITVGAAGGAAKVRHDVRTSHAPERQDFGGMGTGSTQVVWSVDSPNAVLALTFDDGPHPRLTPLVLDLLAEHHMVATFFLIGECAERHPELVARIVAEGHEVANHSAGHATFAHLGRDAAREQVLEGSAAIERVTGVVPRWFRAPRGMINGAVIRAAADLGQDVAMWSCKMRSSAHDLLDELHPGAVVLLHDGTSGREDDEDLEVRRAAEVAVLATVLGGIGDRGYRTVTLSGLVDDEREPTDA